MQTAQPQSIAEVFARAWRLYKKALWRVLPISLLGAFGASIPHVAQAHFVGGIDFSDPLTFARMVWQLHLVLILFSGAVYAAIFYRLQAVIDGKSMSYLHALWHGVKRLPWVFIGLLSYLIIVGLGCIALVVPALILLVSCFFFLPLTAVDNMNAFSAIKRSHLLAWPEWGRAAIVFYLPMIIIMSVSAILRNYTVGVFTVMHASGVQIHILGSTIGTIIGTLYTPWFFALVLVQLRDLQVRERIRVSVSGTLQQG